jgi:uncharacterized membrane protein
MVLFVVLVAAFLVALAVPRRAGRRSPRRAALIAIGVAMVFAGVSHFADPEPFVQLLPEFVPGREALILTTGVIEILLGAGLALARRWRREIALVLVAYLVAVFPANVYAAVADVQVEGLGGGNNWVRLPFQAVYVAWVFWAVPDTLGPARSAVRRLRGVPSRPGPTEEQATLHP